MAPEDHDACFFDGLQQEEYKQNFIDDAEATLGEDPQVKDCKGRFRCLHSPAICDRAGYLKLITRLENTDE